MKLINQKGKEIEDKMTLEKLVWSLPRNEDLVSQAIYVFQSNQRLSNAQAKSRGDVSGGGRKPFRQKGTGRARAGSTRSPLWVKGGVTFVPNDRTWKKKLNDKMKKKAIAVVLSAKLKDEKVKFVKFSKKSESKTLRNDLTTLSSKLKTLVVSESEDILKVVRNLENVKISRPSTLNIFDALNNKLILIDAESVKVIEGRLKNEK